MPQIPLPTHLSTYPPTHPPACTYAPTYRYTHMLTLLDGHNQWTNFTGEGGGGILSCMVSTPKTNRSMRILLFLKSHNCFFIFIFDCNIKRILMHYQLTKEHKFNWVTSAKVIRVKVTFCTRPTTKHISYVQAAYPNIYGPFVVTLLNWTCIFEWYMCKSDKKTHSNLFCLKSDRQKRCESSQKRCENRIFLGIHTFYC